MSLEIIRSLYCSFTREGFDPILVGGWAVSHHGYPRNTLDIDIVLCSEQKDAITALAESLGYQQSSSGTMVTRFQFKDPWYPMLDVIWVNSETYQEMLEHSETSPDSQSIRVISLSDLIAMKLHAMHNNDERDGKDLLDIRSLIRYNSASLSDTELQQLCNKYGPPNAYSMITNSSS